MHPGDSMIWARSPANVPRPKKLTGGCMTKTATPKVVIEPHTAPQEPALSALLVLCPGGYRWSASECARAEGAVDSREQRQKRGCDDVRMAANAEASVATGSRYFDIGNGQRVAACSARVLVVTRQHRSAIPARAQPRRSGPCRCHGGSWARRRPESAVSSSRGRHHRRTSIS